MSKLINIRRYENRKLYNMETSQYTTLEELAHHVKNGWNIDVINNRTKKNITDEVLSKILEKESMDWNIFFKYSLLRGKKDGIVEN